MHRRDRLARMALLGLVVAAPARAWEVAGEATWAAPQGATTLVAGPWAEGAALAFVGPAAAWLVDPASGAVIATVERGGATALLGDHDGDGVSDLVLCGPEGLSWARGAEGTLGPVAPLASEPCAALAPLVLEDGTRALASASESVAVWTIEPGGALRGPDRFGSRLTGPPLLATEGPRLAVASAGDTGIQERSEWGRSTYTARGPVAGLAAGPRSWAWSIPGAGVVADVTRKEVGVAPSAGLLRPADLEGDHLAEVLVVHPEGIGVLAGDRERLVPSPGALDVAAADLDADGCGDLAILRGDGAAHVARGLCPADTVVEAGGTPQEVVLDERDRVVDAWVGQPLRVQFRDPVGGPTQFSGRGGPEGFRIAEDGLVTWIPGSDDVGEWTVSVRLWGGADLVRVVPIRLVVRLPTGRGAGPEEPTSVRLGETAPTVQVLVGETAVLRLEDAVGQATTWRWRGGPPGLQIRSDGLARYTGLQEHVGQWRVELRLKGPGSRRRAAFFLRVAPRSIVTAPEGSPAAAEADRQASVARQPKFLQPHGCVVSLGFAGGLTGARSSWEGTRPVYGSFSPVVAGTCEGGPPGGVQWFAGADSAPLYAYLLDEQAIGVHTLVGTVGVSFGNDAFRIGPYFAAGILMSGVGVRTWWLPFVTRGGIAHGFELRAAYVFASTPSGEAMLMYGWRFGRPR